MSIIKLIQQWNEAYNKDQIRKYAANWKHDGQASSTSYIFDEKIVKYYSCVDCLFYARQLIT